MIVLDGRLDVEDYARVDNGEVPGYAHVEATGWQRLEPGETDFRSGRFDIHRVSATGDASAVSLHVYSAPLRQFLVYDAVAHRCENARSTYDEVLSVYTELRR